MDKEEVTRFLKKEMTGNENATWFQFVKGMFHKVSSTETTLWGKTKIVGIFVVVGTVLCSVSLLFLPLRIMWEVAGVLSNAMDRLFPRA